MKARELSEEELQKLIAEAERRPEEAKFFLRLSEWWRQGPAFTDESIIEVVYGRVYDLTIRRWSEPYPGREGRDLVLIPRTVPVVVLNKIYDDTSDPPINKKIVYVFTGEKWVRIEVD